MSRSIDFQHSNLLLYQQRANANLQPVPQRAQYDQWLLRKPTFASLIGAPWDAQTYAWLDLSAAGGQIQQGSALDRAEAFDRELTALLANQGVRYGLGGYGEERAFYITPAYQTATGAYRNLHLGLDLWTEAGHPLYAPLDGRVHSLENNPAPRDYGPTLLLEHTVPTGLRFWTLYGHLDPDLFDRWQVGDSVIAGTEIARIGKLSDNGQWPPHLHLQVILDLLGAQGDFPGVGTAADRTLWLSLCPDPLPLLGLGN